MRPMPRPMLSPPPRRPPPGLARNDLPREAPDLLDDLTSLLNGLNAPCRAACGGAVCHGALRSRSWAAHAGRRVERLERPSWAGSPGPVLRRPDRHGCGVQD
jgi:hypothetical protein